MAWCCQATSHYLSQCWPRSVLPYDITRPQWVREILTLWIQLPPDLNPDLASQRVSESCAYLIIDTYDIQYHCIQHWPLYTCIMFKSAQPVLQYQNSFCWIWFHEIEPEQWWAHLCHVCVWLNTTWCIQNFSFALLPKLLHISLQIISAKQLKNTNHFQSLVNGIRYENAICILFWKK